MLPIKDAPRPNAGSADPTATPARASAPGSGTPGSGGPAVASQRPSHHGHGGGGHSSHGGHQPGPAHQGGPGAGKPRDAVARDARAQGSPNIQDVFLNYARREKLVVTIQLLDGQSVEGRIKNFDRFALVVDHAGVDSLVFKHAIATIRSPRSIGSYYASHEAS
jgi:host factor-I protein